MREFDEVRVWKDSETSDWCGEVKWTNGAYDFVSRERLSLVVSFIQERVMDGES